jgi:hypothetical protein
VVSQYLSLDAWLNVPMKSFVLIHNCTSKPQYHDLYPLLVVNEVLSYLFNCV